MKNIGKVKKKFQFFILYPRELITLLPTLILLLLPKFKHNEKVNERKKCSLSPKDVRCRIKCLFYFLKKERCSKRFILIIIIKRGNCMVVFVHIL